MTSLKLVSSLPPDLEALATRTIGALLQVHRELGSGMSESIYAAATRTELELHGFPFASEKSVPVLYKGRLLAYRAARELPAADKAATRTPGQLQRIDPEARHSPSHKVKAKKRFVIFVNFEPS
jgi:hypothetical protein